MTLAAGTAFCPNCGSAIPPLGPAIPVPVAAPRKRRTGLIIGIVLVVILVGGVAGFLFYNNVQQQVLQTAKNTEQVTANQAVNQIQFTCLSVATDGSHLSHDSYYGYSGYAEIRETFGLSNPTRFQIDATWSFKLNFTAVHLVTTSTASFRLPASGAARPVLAFQITGAQYNSLPSNPDLSKFEVTLDAAYTVAGIYSTYNLSQHSMFNSATQSGTGGLGSSASLSSCA